VKISRHGWHRLFGVLVVGTALATFAQSVVAADAEDGESDNSAATVPRHRIDISAVFLNGASTDSVDGIVGYTYNLTGNTNFNVTVPYLDPDRSTGGNSGFGDTILSVSYVPLVKVSANPWVPRTVGTGISILAPTGNADEGRSLDTWVITPFLGLVIPLTDHFFLAPQLGYVHSLNKTVVDTDLRLAFAEVGFAYVSSKGFWASYFPRFAFDLERDDWAIDHRLSIGKMVTETFGLSVDYVFVERFNLGSDVPNARGFDEQIELNVHFAY
jgi:hypothetical protein